MSVAPNVTVTADKVDYAPGDPITLTFTVDADTRTDTVDRTVTYTGHDDEGNDVSGVFVVKTKVQVADGFTLDSVVWEDTGVAFTVQGLTAFSTV